MPFCYKDTDSTTLRVEPKKLKWESIPYDWNHDSFIPNHDIGNILSYHPPEENMNVSPLDFSYKKLAEVTLPISDNPRTESVGYEEIKDKTVITSHAFGFSADFLLKVGFEGKISTKPVSYGVNIGFDIGTNAFYDQNEIKTIQNSISNSWELSYMTAHVDGALPGGGDAKYTIEPYVYRSYNGVLTLDFSTTPNAVWWNDKYGDKPDLTFILPKRYHTEMGIGTFPSGREYQRYKTKDIFLDPGKPSIGDTVEIMTRIHNYSLAGISPNDSIIIRYYLGDPDDGGLLISDIVQKGSAQSQKYNIREPRSETWYYASWIIPANIEADARLYVAIDPDNTIDEIHENNNKGYINLNIKGLTGTDDDLNNVLPKEYKLSQNYPNPFNPSTHIQFSLPKTEIVKVEIFDIMGQRVKTLLHEKRNAGNHKFKFDANKFASGVYFYKITAGEFIKVKKMMFLK